MMSEVSTCMKFSLKKKLSELYHHTLLFHITQFHNPTFRHSFHWDPVNSPRDLSVGRLSHLSLLLDSSLNLCQFLVPYKNPSGPQS